MIIPALEGVDMFKTRHTTNNQKPNQLIIKAVINMADERHALLIRIMWREPFSAY